ncbi:hypothetical protein [Inquilinus sp. CA228]|uniref:hypothetical protein n=1 Tax=Inquilinus sp. CA228 TaxID=3455609 RepID=UPI003F8D3894
MSRKIAALARGGTMFAVLALASCQGSESATKVPVATTQPVTAQTAAAQSAKIPESCLSPMQALTSRSQETWDKMIGDRSYRYDTKAESDFTKPLISSYLKAGCKEKPGADLGNCIADGTESDLPSMAANHALHDRCFAAFLANY